MQSLDRAVQVLDVLSKTTDGMPITELSDRIGLSLSTTHRFLQSLINNGLVIQDPISRRYKLGLRLLSLASGLLKSDRLLELSREAMQRAAVLSGNVVYLCKQQNKEIVCVSATNPIDGIIPSFAVQVGNTLPVHACAAAKIIMAYQPEPFLRGLLRELSPLPQYTKKTTADIEHVLRDYKHCREVGYALCDEEIHLGVIAVAAPIFNYDGSVLGSIGVTCVKAHTSVPTLVKTICESANEISRLMGAN